MNENDDLPVTEYMLRCYGKRLGYDGLSSDETVATFYALDHKIYRWRWGEATIVTPSAALDEVRDTLSKIRASGVYCDEDAWIVRNINRLLSNLHGIEIAQDWATYK